MVILAYVFFVIFSGLAVRNQVKEHDLFSWKYYDGCIQFNSIHFSVLLLIIGILTGLSLIHKEVLLTFVSLYFILFSTSYNKRIIVEEDGIILRNNGKETYIRWEDMNSLKISNTKYARIRIETETEKIKMNIYGMFNIGELTRYLNKYALKHDIKFSNTGISLSSLS